MKFREWAKERGWSNEDVIQYLCDFINEKGLTESLDSITEDSNIWIQEFSEEEPENIKRHQLVTVKRIGRLRTLHKCVKCGSEFTLSNYIDPNSDLSTGNCVDILIEAVQES